MRGKRERGTFRLTLHPSGEELLPPLPVCGGLEHVGALGSGQKSTIPGQAAIRCLPFLLL